MGDKRLASWKNVFLSAAGEQFYQTTRLLFINLLFDVFTGLILLFTNSGINYWSDALIISILIWGFIFSAISIVRLALVIQRQVRSNRYQLLPFTNWKTYIMQLLSCIGNILYVLAVQTVLFIGTLFISLAHYHKQKITTIFNGNFGQGFIAVFCIVMLFTFMIVLLINLIDFISQFVLDYVPLTASRLVKWLVYIAIMVLTIKVILRVLSTFNSVGSPAEFELNMGLHGIQANYNLAIDPVVWLTNSEFVLLNFVLISLNSWLVQRIETNK